MNTEKVETLKHQLQEGIVSFKYEKKDGTIREAKGTTKMDIVEEYVRESPKQTTTKERKVNENQVRYFDIDKEQWRSFCKDKFIDIIENEF